MTVYRVRYRCTGTNTIITGRYKKIYFLNNLDDGDWKQVWSYTAYWRTYSTVLLHLLMSDQLLLETQFCFALIVCTCRLGQLFADNANSNRKKKAGVGSLDPDLKENKKLPVHLLVNEFNGAVSHFYHKQLWQVPVQRYRYRVPRYGEFRFLLGKIILCQIPSLSKLKAESRPFYFKVPVHAPQPRRKGQESTGA